MKNDIAEVLALGISFGLVALVVLLLFLSYKEKDSKPPMSKQNVVCDLVYGVQYFEHNGSLTVRVNHEGVPIKCYE